MQLPFRGRFLLQRLLSRVASMHCVACALQLLVERCAVSTWTSRRTKIHGTRHFLSTLSTENSTPKKHSFFFLSSFFFFFAFLPLEPCRVSGSPIRGCGTDFSFPRNRLLHACKSCSSCINIDATGAADGIKNSLSNYWVLSRFDMGPLLKHEESYLCRSIGPIEVGSFG